MMYTYTSGGKTVISDKMDLDQAQTSGRWVKSDTVLAVRE